MANASRSLRRHLLVGILVPIALFVLVDTVTLYRQAFSAVNTAYDRTLLASAKSIGEMLEVTGEGSEAVLRATVPYAALEAFEADNRSVMVYRISNVKGDVIGGEADLPAWHGRIPDQGPYAALVDFYDDKFRGTAVRVAVLLQPVASQSGLGMATIQVAETLDLRRTLARQILIDTLWRQSILTGVIALVVVVVVQRATRPVRDLSARLRTRPQGDLEPIDALHIPRELHPLVDATNQVMARLQNLLDNQKRFIRDASHQLRTPLAVLKAQVQSAARGDVEPVQALQEISSTVDRATTLANQMLALAKVQQLKTQEDTQTQDLAQIVRATAVELSPLLAEKNIDFEVNTSATTLQAHEWMLRELARNLIHNAIKHAPADAQIVVNTRANTSDATLEVFNSGPGISAELQSRLFQPFSAGHAHSGSGLGLMICKDIAQAMGGSIMIKNWSRSVGVSGVMATVHLPLGHAPLKVA